MSFIQCNGHTIHYSYRDNSRDRTLLFINSLGTDFRIWNDVVNNFKAHGNILIYDKRGHGLSDFSVAKNGLNDYAEDAWYLLESLSIKKCIVIGISVGGMIAQILAYNHPEEIEKLVLCDTAQKIGTDETWNDRISQVRTNGLKTISDGIMQRWFSSAFHARQPAKVAGYKNMVERCDAAGYIQTCEAIRNADITGISKSLKIPTLCIAGEEDLSTTPAEVKFLSGLISNSGFEVIEGSAHIPCVDNTEIFTKLVIEFIK